MSLAVRGGARGFAVYELIAIIIFLVVFGIYIYFDQREARIRQANLDVEESIENERIESATLDSRYALVRREMVAVERRLEYVQSEIKAQNNRSEISRAKLNALKDEERKLSEALAKLKELHSLDPDELEGFESKSGVYDSVFDLRN